MHTTKRYDRTVARSESKLFSCFFFGRRDVCIFIVFSNSFNQPNLTHRMNFNPLYEAILICSFKNYVQTAIVCTKICSEVFEKLIDRKDLNTHTHSNRKIPLELPSVGWHSYVFTVAIFVFPGVSMKSTS